MLLVAVFSTVDAVAVDRTREERAVGAEIVQAVVDLIRENCIYPKDRLYLRRLAYVESKDGLDPSTFRSGFYGGIWQVGHNFYLFVECKSESLKHGSMNCDIYGPPSKIRNQTLHDETIKQT